MPNFAHIELSRYRLKDFSAEDLVLNKLYKGWYNRLHEYIKRYSYLR
jgi:hypothetical protein